MTSLPSGTVAFLLTDIEGSTRLIGRLGDAYPRILGEHDAVLSEAVAGNGGTVVSHEGDSVFGVFPSVRQALAAAVAGQRALAAHPWPAGVEVRIRMGLHVGEAVLGGRDYTGIDVHRAARIMGAGHGGQILISEAARGLLGESSEDLAFRDLGVHGLRDLPASERLFQVVAPGLGAEFPPLRTQRASAPTNLPNPLTRFVGRLREIGEVRSTISSRPDYARGRFEEAIEVARGVGDKQFLMGALQGRSLAFLQLGEFDAARGSIGDAIDLGRATGDHYMTSINLVTLGFLEIRQGREAVARERIVEALHLAHDASAAIGTSLALDSLASLALGQGDLVRGATLAGTADRLRLEIGGGASISISGVEEPLVQARRLMPADELEVAVAAGRALTTDEAVAMALDVNAPARTIDP